MRILASHVTRDFLVTLAASFLVFTFVASIGVMFKAIEFLARGVAPGAILALVFSGVPGALSYSIPIAALTASLLVFGRLSADSEITAMKACGIGIWQIVRRPVAFAVLLSFVCAYLNGYVAPRSHLARRKMAAELTIEDAADLIEPGRFIQDFRDMVLYVGSIKDGRIRDVRIYDLSRPGIRREVHARTGRIRSEGNDLFIDVYDALIDPIDPPRPGAGECGEWTLKISEDAIRRGEYVPKKEDLTLDELVERIRYTGMFYPELDDRDTEEQKMHLSFELGRRLSLAAACVAFVLVGIPFGIKTHRRESSVGVAVSLLFVFLFYMFIVLAKAFSNRPEARPDLIVWAPVIICSAAGIRMLRRSN